MSSSVNTCGWQRDISEALLNISKRNLKQVEKEEAGNKKLVLNTYIRMRKLIVDS